MKDLNDAAKAGKADALLGAADATRPVAPADSTALALDGIKHLKAIISQVQLDLQDPLEGPTKAAASIVKATQAEKHRWVLGAAAHDRAAEVESLLAMLGTVVPAKLKSQVSALRKIVAAGKKEFVDAVRDREALKGSLPEASPKRMLGAVLKGLGDYDFRMPAGYEMDLEGVRTDTGEMVAPAPILPIAFEQAPDGEIVVTVAWRKWGAWVQHKFSRGVLASSKKLVDMASKGAPVDSITAPLLMAFFTAFERVNEAALRPMTSAPHIGWNGDTFLYGSEVVGDSPLSPPADPAAAQFFAGFRSEGSWDAWREAIADYVTQHPSVMIGIYASAASLMLEPLNERGFVVDWSGLTSVGKTTTLMVAASALGNPGESDQNGLLRSWRSPSNSSRMYMASVLHSFPLYLDETKRADKPELVKNFLYDFPSGQDSMRGREDGTARIAKRWRSIALTTGEAPIVSFARDGGAHARALCIQGPPWGKPNAEQAVIQKRLSQILQRNYGHLGPHLVKYLLDVDRHDLRERYRSILDGYPTSSGVAARMLSYVAVLELAAQVCHFSLDLPGAHQESIKILIDIVLGGQAGANMARQAADTLYQWASANRDKFWHHRATHEPVGGWLGRWDPDEHRSGFIAFDQHRASKFLSECGFDAASVWTAFRENGWMILKDGANPQVGPSRSRLPCVKLSALTDES